MSNSPLWTASRIFLVTDKLILFPTPYLPPDHPVFNNQQLTLNFYIFLANISAYTVGCKGKNASPKHGEKVLYGSFMPTSVPATFDVYPEIKWYIAYSGDNFEIGGKTPNESQVKNIRLLGWPPTAGNLAFFICCKG